MKFKAAALIPLLCLSLLFSACLSEVYNSPEEISDAESNTLDKKTATAESKSEMPDEIICEVRTNDDYEREFSFIEAPAGKNITENPIILRPDDPDEIPLKIGRFSLLNLLNNSTNMASLTLEIPEIEKDADTEKKLRIDLSIYASTGDSLPEIPAAEVVISNDLDFKIDYTEFNISVRCHTRKKDI